jgi:hypothetical protein
VVKEKTAKLGALKLDVLLLLFSIIQLSSEVYSRDSLFVVPSSLVKGVVAFLLARLLQLSYSAVSFKQCPVSGR